MYLRKEKRKDRVYLSIVHGYRECGTGKSKKKTIKTLGYLDQLEKEYEDPIKHFQEVAKELTEKHNELTKPISLEIDRTKKLNPNENITKNFGYAAFSSIYHELKLDTFFNQKQRGLNIEFNLNSMMKMLIYGRLINPSSKKHTYDNRHMFLDKMDFSLDDVYRTLTHITSYKEDIEKWIHKNIQKNYGRNTQLTYYDVTNYYFEIDEQDDFRRKGVSKEHRPNPIVQMGLMMDENGIPISYDLFSGNTNDTLTLRGILSGARKNLDIGKVIVVADKGLNSGDNIYYTLSGNNGYVFSQTVRGANKELKDFILKEDGYIHINGKHKRKSRLVSREISVTSLSGKKIKKTIAEKQVVFYSKKYAKKARAERELALKKARKIISNPGAFNKATSYGSAKYIDNMCYDKKTGEILSQGHVLTICEKRIKEEELFDGYYVLISSELEKSDQEIIEIYKGLWKIEESFKITKSELKARPIYVSTEDHIRAHFLTCFMALTLSRILESKINGKHYVGAILASLKKSNYTLIEKNTYTLTYYDEVLKDIGQAVNIDFSTKYRTRKELKKIVGKAKN